MGYEINSTWTRISQKSIEKLNEIIDDKYCKELEIGRKLDIMDKLTDEFDKEINSLNWDNITKFMKEHDWTWYMGGNLNNCRTPTKEEMIERLKKDFLKHGLYEIIELDKDRFSSFSGGFNVEMGVTNGMYWVHICFDIAHI